MIDRGLTTPGFARDLSGKGHGTMTSAIALLGVRPWPSNFTDVATDLGASGPELPSAA